MASPAPRNPDAAPCPRQRVTFAFSWQDVIENTQSAPWAWWVAALIVMLALLLLGMKMLGLWPE